MSLLKNGILIAIVAHGLIGASLVWDKVLLRRPETRNLPSYVFWLGALSVLGLCLIPFGFRLPSAKMVATAFLAGVIHLAAVWFYYDALKRGEASQTLAIMGGFSPLATALIGKAVLAKPLGGSSVAGFGLLVGGGFLMFFAEQLDWRRVLPSVLLSAGLFGVTNVLQKVVFNATGFISGYVVFTGGTAAGAAAMLLWPRWRKQIFTESEEAPPKSKKRLIALASAGHFWVSARSQRPGESMISRVRWMIRMSFWVTGGRSLHPGDAMRALGSLPSSRRLMCCASNSKNFCTSANVVVGSLL